LFELRHSGFLSKKRSVARTGFHSIRCKRETIGRWYWLRPE
jgi:hypothetical protein